MLARNPYPLLLRLLAALFLAVSALPLATPPTAFAATRQVAKTGSADTGACTGTPCLTITYAISQATAGDAITVGAGTYNERFTIDRHLTLTGAGVGSTIINGQASGRVVFVNLGVTATITGVTLTNGSSNTVGGGGIYNDGTLTVQNSAISGNTSEATGGGIANYGGLTIQNSTIAGNSAPNDAGGGIFNDGQLTVQNSTLSGNSATDGGGIYNGIEATFIGSAITGNHASSDDAGGGLQIIGMLTLQNSTVSGNTASGADSAGAMRVAGAAVVTIISSTIANNDGAVGGIKQTTGTVTLKRSIVASQQAGTNCSGTITDGGHNLVGSGSNCGLTNGVNGNVVTATPLLGALAGNGGSTQTIALQTGSPAINAVPTGSCLDKDNAALTQDQRGSPRPVGGACDMGAFEVQGADPTPPTCVLTSGPTLVSGHTQIQVTVQDTGSGLQTIASVGTTNATLSGNTGFTVGSTSARVVTATKTVEGQTARVLLQVTDVAGNTTPCDPVLTDLSNSPWSPVLRQTYGGLDGAERWVLVQNGAPGLRAVRFTVNGRVYWMRGLRDGEERLLDIAAALHEGTDNTVIVEAAALGGSARLMIGDLAPVVLQRAEEPRTPESGAGLPGVAGRYGDGSDANAGGWPASVGW